MILQPVINCRKDLAFDGANPWPDFLPPLAWRSYLLCGFERDHGDAFNYTLGDQKLLIQLLAFCQPQLGLGSAIALAPKINLLGENGPAVLLSAYGWRNEADHHKILELGIKWPQSFLDWLNERQIVPRELLPILSLPEGQYLQKILTEIVRLRLSKQNGLKALELAVDLSLAQQPIPMNDVHDQSGESWLKSLWKARYPMTFDKDEERRAWVKKWAWPKNVSAESLRVGDENQLRIQIQAQSPVELQRRLKELNQIANAWNS